MKPARARPMNHGSNWLRSALLQRLMWSRNDIGWGIAYHPAHDGRRIAAASREDPAGGRPARCLRRGMPGSGCAPALLAQAWRYMVACGAAVARRHLPARGSGVELIADASLRHRA